MADRQVEQAERALIDAWARSLGTVADFRVLIYAYRDAILERARGPVPASRLTPWILDDLIGREGDRIAEAFSEAPHSVPSDPGW